MESEAPYQYIVVHRSLAEYPGVLAVQVAHAAAESVRCLPVSDKTVVCVLVAEKSEELELLGARLREAHVEHIVIREPEPPYEGKATAVGISPQDRQQVRPHVAGYQVLRRERR